MGLYNGAVITAAGQNLLAQAISGTELAWTAMRASSVTIPEGTDLTTLTALTGIKQTTDVTDSSVYGSNVVQVSARFSNTGIDTAYLMETIGIYGQVTGGSETLIAVMTAETPDEMPVYDQDSPSAFIFNVQMSVQNANAITMVVNDTGTATVADLRRKVSLDGGDLSDTVVDTFTATTAEYPVPAAGDTMKVICGKIVKFCADIVKPFTKATASAAGAKGLVPAPAAGDQIAYLRGDGTWEDPVNNTTTTVAGRVLDARQANPNISGTYAYSVKQQLDAKVDATHGDISNTRVDTIDTVTNEYPTPPQGRVLSYVIGCVKKFLNDLKENKVESDGGFIGTTTFGSEVAADQPYQTINTEDTVAEAVGKLNYTTLQAQQDINALIDSFTAKTVSNLNDSSIPTGIYAFTANATGVPRNTAGVLINIQTASYVRQIAVSGTTNSAPLTYVRNHPRADDSTWSEWTELATADSIIKSMTTTLTTNTAGNVYGATGAFGLPDNVKIICAYFNRGSYSAYRSVTVGMYGSAGYSLHFEDNNTAVASAQVSVTIYYIL